MVALTFTTMWCDKKLCSEDIHVRIFCGSEIGIFNQPVS